MLLNFLKLHDADDNSIIIVNQTLITLIHISVINNKKNTIIYIKFITFFTIFIELFIFKISNSIYNQYSSKI